MAKNYRKVIFAISLFVVLALTLTGCGTKKTTTSEEEVISKMSATSDNAESGTTGSATATAELPQFDSGAVDSEYQKNYTQALTSVNTYFQNQAEFCATIIDFSQDSIEFANQYFFFNAANNQVKDWYGVVEIDPLLKVAKRQLFAKKDYAETIKCVSAATTTPPNFTTAYSAFLKDFPDAPTTSAKTQIALLDTIWRITAWDADGGVVATQDISTSGVTASAGPTASATSGL